ncbi:MAG: ErfK/YbiS/YcfS/YnhG family protein [Humibacillus sp.]|nr:ErfK/YbiS/YcfS/YnhG family protein [Humibacillus sp.]
MEQQNRHSSPAARWLAVGATLTLTFGAAACSSSSPLGAGPTNVSATARAVTPAAAPAAPSAASVAATTRTAIPTTTASPLSPDPTASADPSAQPLADPPATPVVKPAAAPAAQPVKATPPAKPAATASPKPKPSPSPSPEADRPAPAIVLSEGDTGPTVRDLQARLRQIGWYSGDVVNRYGPKTVAAVRGFQTRRSLPVTGAVDEVTQARLRAMTIRPTADELANVTPKPPAPKPAPQPAATPTTPAKPTWDVDERCLTGRVMCVSKTTRQLTWVVDGVPQYGFDVRFGSDELPTREGAFSVYKKKVDVISNLYHTPMPYSMFFSGGQAVHYSTNFARLGYSGASHGCVNVRDKALLVRLYGEVRIGDSVVVHW